MRCYAFVYVWESIVTLDLMKLFGMFIIYIIITNIFYVESFIDINPTWRLEIFACL